jgi:pyruvate/2-oxoacid:ferredoxin oxidoreductase beta subunit
MRNEIPLEENLNSGHLACPGCGGSLSMRLALKALGRKTYLVLTACCWSIIDGPFPYSAVKIPLMHTAFETAGSAASGIRAALDILGKKDITVMAWAGDGGTFDIGIQALSGAAERNEDFIYSCYDNEAYMNTGIQRSSGTPWGAWTTTTPESKGEQKKKIMEIMAAHRIPYAATLSPAYPEDFIRKYKKAKSIKGTKFMHILSPCPPGWKTSSEQSMKLSRMAVESGVFPLYEIENGTKYTLNNPTADFKIKPINEYISMQGRFRHLNKEQIKFMQENVTSEWQRLLRKLKYA